MQRDAAMEMLKGEIKKSAQRKMKGRKLKMIRRKMCF